MPKPSVLSYLYHLLFEFLINACHLTYLLSKILLVLLHHSLSPRSLSPSPYKTLVSKNDSTKLVQESLLGTDWRGIKGQVLASGSNIKQPSRKKIIDSTSLGDSKSTDTSTGIPMDELCAVDSATVPSISRAVEASIPS